MQTKQNVEIAQTEQKRIHKMKLQKKVINPVRLSQKKLKFQNQFKKVEESFWWDVDVEDKDSTEPILDKDTLAKAMNFMAGM